MHPFSTPWYFQGEENGCIGNEWVNPAPQYKNEITNILTGLKWKRNLRLLSQDSVLDKKDNQSPHTWIWIAFYENGFIFFSLQFVTADL